MIRPLLILILVIFLGYGVIEALPLLQGPSLSISTNIVRDGIVEITGTAKRAVNVTLNGAPVLRAEDGAFALVRTFPHGGSILTFEAIDRFGKSIHASRSLFIP